MDAILQMLVDVIGKVGEEHLGERFVRYLS